MKSFILLSALFLSLSAEAFTMNNSAKLVFAQDEVNVNVASGLCNNIGISDDELLSIVGDAVNQFWNKASTSRLKLRKGSVVSVNTSFYTDTICLPSTNCEPNPTLSVSSDILITCNNNGANFSSSSVLGVTIPNNISGSNIVGSLIMINDLSSTQFDSKSRAEKVSIIAHELGHAFGLGHSPVTDSLMYYATMENRSALGRDDIDGISYLYPKQQPFKGGCGTIDLGNNNKPNWWSGLFIGFSAVFLAEILRKKQKLKRGI
jgi:Matrixin